MRAFIALPVSGLCQDVLKERISQIRLKLAEKGYGGVSPTEIYSGHNPSYDDKICSTLRAALDCDAIYFAEGWQMSTGCKILRETVRLINIKRESEGKKKITIIGSL